MSAIIASMVKSRTMSSQTSGAAMPRSGVRERGAVDARRALADRDQVFAAVLQAAGDFVGEFLLGQRRADGLQVAPVGGPGERGDLRAGVVDVVFLGDVEAGLGQQVGERVAHHGAAAMADMHRAGGVGGDILDVDPRAGAGGGSRRRPLRRAGWPAAGRGTPRVEAEVDEAGPGGGGLGDVGAAAQARRPGRRRASRAAGARAWRTPGRRWSPCRHARIAGRGDLHASGDVVRQVGDDGCTAARTVSRMAAKVGSCNSHRSSFGRAGAPPRDATKVAAAPWISRRGSGISAIRLHAVGFSDGGPTRARWRCAGRPSSEDHHGPDAAALPSQSGIAVTGRSAPGGFQARVPLTPPKTTTAVRSSPASPRYRSAAGARPSRSGPSSPPRNRRR